MGDLSKDFDTDEFKCKCGCGRIKVHIHLVEYLQKLRDAYGKRIDISSGYRCNEWNKHEGGKSNSVHLTGKAADIVIPNSNARFKLINYALTMGFRRIGIGSNFLHLDMDTTKPQDVCWTY